MHGLCCLRTVPNRHTSGFSSLQSISVLSLVSLMGLGGFGTLGHAMKEGVCGKTQDKAERQNASAIGSRAEAGAGAGALATAAKTYLRSAGRSVERLTHFPYGNFPDVPKAVLTLDELDTALRALDREATLADVAEATFANTRPTVAFDIDNPAHAAERIALEGAADLHRELWLYSGRNPSTFVQDNPELARYLVGDRLLGSYKRPSNDFRREFWFRYENLKRGSVFMKSESLRGRINIYGDHIDMGQPLGPYRYTDDAHPYNFVPSDLPARSALDIEDWLAAAVQIERNPHNPSAAISELMRSDELTQVEATFGKEVLHDYLVGMRSAGIDSGIESLKAVQGRKPILDLSEGEETTTRLIAALNGLGAGMLTTVEIFLRDNLDSGLVDRLFTAAAIRDPNASPIAKSTLRRQFGEKLVFSRPRSSLPDL